MGNVCILNNLVCVALTLALTVVGQNSPSSNLVTCLVNASVPVVISGDPTYVNESTPFNSRYENVYTPVAIAVPVTNAHVSSAVTCACANNVKVQAKGGGHSYAAFSLGGENGSLVVSMENFQNVSVDANDIATVGAGLRLGNMALALLNGSQRALPHGSCPGVGIGGHATHGGYGYASRNWGLALDTIVALDAVLANGSIIHATAKDYPDLFFALRGAADSIGIVTTFYMQTFPAPEAIVHFTYAFGPGVLNGTGETAADMLDHIQEFSQNASVVDRRFAFGIYIDPATFSWNGIFYGTQEDFSNRIKPEMLRTLPPANETLSTVDWGELLAILAEGSGPLVTPTGALYDEHSDFVSSLTLALSDIAISTDETAVR